MSNFKSQAKINGSNVAKAETSIPKRLAELAAILKGKTRDEVTIIRDAWKEGYAQSRKQETGNEPSKGAIDKAWSKYSSCAKRGETSLESAQKRPKKDATTKGPDKRKKSKSDTAPVSNIPAGLRDPDLAQFSKVQIGRVRGELQKASNALVTVHTEDKIAIAALAKVSSALDLAITTLKTK